MISWPEVESKLASTQSLPAELCSTCILPIGRGNIRTSSGCLSCDAARQRIAAGIEVLGTNLPLPKGGGIDCVVGMSGGVDSSFLVMWLVEHGFTPHCIHLDNGWNTARATNNIHKIVASLGVSFESVVLDWGEFQRMQLALLDADIVDFENASDHFIFSSLFKASKDLGNVPIVQGINLMSENAMQPGLIHSKHDAIHLKYLYWRKYRSSPKKLPFFSNVDIIYAKRIRGTTWISGLDYIDYNKEAACKLLIDRFGYQPPERKHEESIVTKVYQRVLLPIKFNQDKRLGHLSSLINSGQLTREAAVVAAREPFYSDVTELRNDVSTFLRYLEMPFESFLCYLSRPQKAHSSYLSDQLYVRPAMRLFKVAASFF